MVPQYRSHLRDLVTRTGAEQAVRAARQARQVGRVLEARSA